jgi:hypothetical protein
LTYYVGDQTGAPHLLGGMLCRLGLLLPVDDWDVRHGYAEEILSTESVPELHQCLYEWAGLNITRIYQSRYWAPDEQKVYPTVPPYGQGVRVRDPFNKENVPTQLSVVSTLLRSFLKTY